MNQRKIPYDTHHQGVISGASKLISKHIVCSMQTVHLSCIKISTISKQIKLSFHLSTIGCVENGFLSYRALGANRASILHRN